MNLMIVLAGKNPGWMERWICAANGKRRRWREFEHLALKSVAEARNHHLCWQDPMQKVGFRGRPRAAEWMADDDSQGKQQSVLLRGRGCACLPFPRSQDAVSSVLLQPKGFEKIRMKTY